jgi:hypothetical protein
MSKGKHIPRDNKTRWNSYAEMIKAALLPQVRQAINRWFLERPEDQDVSEIITDKDWVILERVSLA